MLVHPGQPDPVPVALGVQRVRLADVGYPGPAGHRADQPGPAGQPAAGRDRQVGVRAAAEDQAAALRDTHHQPRRRAHPGRHGGGGLVIHGLLPVGERCGGHPGRGWGRMRDCPGTDSGPAAERSASQSLGRAAQPGGSRNPGMACRRVDAVGWAKSRGEVRTWPAGPVFHVGRRARAGAQVTARAGAQGGGRSRPTRSWGDPRARIWHLAPGCARRPAGRRVPPRFVH